MENCIKLLISSKHLTDIINNAINGNCEYFFISPKNNLMLFLGTVFSFKEDICVVNPRYESIVSHSVKPIDFIDILKTLSIMDDQPILLEITRESPLCMLITPQK